MLFSWLKNLFVKKSEPESVSDAMRRIATELRENPMTEEEVDAMFEHWDRVRSTYTRESSYRLAELQSRTPAMDMMLEIELGIYGSREEEE